MKIENCLFVSTCTQSLPIKGREAEREHSILLRSRFIVRLPSLKKEGLEKDSIVKRLL